MSFDHAYRRTVIDVLGKDAADDTYAGLAGLMNVDGDPADESVRRHILDNTLIRRIDRFDPDSIGWQRSARLAPTPSGPVSFMVSKRDLPDELPSGWSLRPCEDGRIEVRAERLDVLIADKRASKVTSAGQTPAGFEPDKLYPSRNHPRGLQLNVYGASDAVQSVGIPWERFRKHVRPDEFAAYSGSAMGQLDNCGNGGMMQAPMMGKRPTAKQAALGLPEMPVDFVNAYVIGSVGQTAGVIGACATFLYNLKAAVDEIRAGRCRVAVVGGAEAPIVPEVVEAYRTMGALAEDEALMALDGAHAVDNRRACRPFARNCGFTLAEAAVYVVVADDALAIELGADIHAAVGDVFVNADGFKKSIPGPGIGNYVTVAKAMACARAILGEDALRHRSYVHAHGTGTPQNRVTESHILNEMAKTFGIDRWTVAAVKAYVGHTLAPASGDQTSSALGTWRYGWIPGIATIDRPADDVQHSNLRIAPEHVEVDPDSLDLAFVNSKGFGGNNATGVLLSPRVAREMLKARHGAQAMRRHARLNDAVHGKALDYDAAATRGDAQTIYRYGQGVLDGGDLRLSTEEIVVPGHDQPVSLAARNPYAD